MAQNNDIYLDEDTRLMLKAKNGDKKAYGKLYSKHFSAVISFITSINGHLRLQEDIAQDVFLRVWRDREKYQPKSAFKTYLFHYAKIVLCEYEASACQAVPIDGEECENLIANLPQHDASSQTEDVTNQLKKLIAQLPNKQKRIIELVYLNGSSAIETSKILRCSVRCVYANLYKAKKNLRKLATDYLLREK